MQEVKIFVGPITRPSGSICQGVTLDEKVNEFLAKTWTRIIDIKFSVTASGENMTGSVMIVYDRDKYEGES